MTEMRVVVAVRRAVRRADKQKAGEKLTQFVRKVSGKFIGDPDPVGSIVEIPTPRSLDELRLIAGIEILVEEPIPVEPQVNIKPSFGANCPPNHQWQLGKTAGTIRFVNNLQSKLEGLTSEDQSKLQAIIDSLKAGTKTLTEAAAENQVFLGGL